MRASEQIRRASEWWRVNRPSVPEAIDEELQRTFAMLLAGGGVGQPVRTTRRRNMMRVHLRRIHYYLYFRVNGDIIEILAFWHTSRGSGPPI